MIEGAGTLTTGGTLEKGKILNGIANQLKVGDLVFIPSGVPHGVGDVRGATSVEQSVGSDYPTGARLGAGRAPQATAPTPATGRRRHRTA